MHKLKYNEDEHGNILCGAPKSTLNIIWKYNLMLAGRFHPIAPTLGINYDNREASKQ